MHWTEQSCWRATGIFNLNINEQTAGNKNQRLLNCLVSINLLKNSDFRPEDRILLSSLRAHRTYRLSHRHIPASLSYLWTASFLETKKRLYQRWDHLINTTTSLLWPLFLARQNVYIFPYKNTSLLRPSVNATTLYWPAGGRINGVLLYYKNWLQSSFPTLKTSYLREDSLTNLL